MHSFELVLQLQWLAGSGVACCHSGVGCFGVSYYGFEIFQVNCHMHVFFDVVILEVTFVCCYRCVHGVFQYFYLGLVNRNSELGGRVVHTFAFSDFGRKTCKHCPSGIGVHIQLFGRYTEVFNDLLEESWISRPRARGFGFVEDGMLDRGRLVSKFV
jgi:hypothetical protein